MPAVPPSILREYPYKIFSVDCALKFIVTEPPKAGSVRILDREGEAAELLHLAATAPRRKHGLRRIAIPTPRWKTSRRTRSPRLRSKGGRHEHVPLSLFGKRLEPYTW